MASDANALMPSATVPRASMSRPEFGLVQHREFRLEQQHLQYLVAFFFAAGKSGVDAAPQKLRREAQPRRGFPRQRDERRGGQLVASKRLVAAVHGRLEELHVADARDVHRILKREEQAEMGPRIRGHPHEARALEPHVARGHFDLGPSGEGIRQGALAGSIGAHDGVHFPGPNREVDAVQDRLARSACLQVHDFEHWSAPAAIPRRLRGSLPGACPLPRRTPSGVAERLPCKSH